MMFPNGLGDLPLENPNKVVKVKENNIDVPSFSSKSRATGVAITEETYSESEEDEDGEGLEESDSFQSSAQTSELLTESGVSQNGLTEHMRLNKDNF